MTKIEIISALEEVHAECVHLLGANSRATARELIRATEARVARAERALGHTPGPAGALNWAGRLARAQTTFARARARVITRARARGWCPRSVGWVRGRFGLLSAAEAAARTGERLARLVCRANGGVMPPDPS